MNETNIEKINNLETQFFLLKENYINSYVLYKNNPSINEYRNQFNSVEGKLDKLDGNVFMMENNLNNDINKLKNELNELVTNINLKKDNINKKQKVLNNLMNNDSAAIKLYEDKIMLYNKNFLNLVIYILGSIGMVYLGYKKYKENI